MKIKKNFLFLTILLFLFLLISLKVIDFFFQKKYGLGNPIYYVPSNKHGYLIKPNQKILRRGNKVVINNRGMRNTEDWKQESKKTKIAFFGGSVTYGGSIVSNKDLFTKKTCDLLNANSQNKFLCGNYGVNGYNIESITKLIKFRTFYDEDLIVVNLVASDAERVFHNIGSQPFWNKKIPTFYPALTEIFFIYLENFKNKTKHKFTNQESIGKNEEYYLYIIKNLSNALEQSKKKYIVLYSPERDELFEPKHKKNIIIKQVLKNNLNNFYDLTEDLMTYKNNFYDDFIHLNPRGHRIFGMIISKKIKEILLKKNI